MNTKKKLNCYLYSNLIVCFLSLNFFVNSKTTTLVAATKDKGVFSNIYRAVEVLAYNQEQVEEVEVAPINNETSKPETTKINVGVRTVTSKKVIPYIKPSYDSVTGSNLVSYAKHYLGLRYVSAGRSLKTGTDCSGFTMLIYREFGISLGPTVSSQIYSGKYVSKSDLKPGDLVFYGNGSGRASHVAIYMGNGMIIHQSNPRDGVKISSLNIMVYITARRVIFEKTKPKVETKKEETVKPNVSEEKPSTSEEKDKNDEKESTVPSTPDVNETPEVQEKPTDPETQVDPKPSESVNPPTESKPEEDKKEETPPVQDNQNDTNNQSSEANDSNKSETDTSTNLE